MTDLTPITVERAAEMLADFGLSAEKRAELEQLAAYAAPVDESSLNIWYRIFSHTTFVLEASPSAKLE